MKDDERLFRAALADAKPLGGRRVVVARPPSARSLLRDKAIGREITAEPAPTRQPLPPLSTERAPGLDRATLQNMRRGRLQPDAALDLHGRTLQQAEQALSRVLAQGQAMGWRSLLVVTGKGLRLDDGSMQGGRIRAHFLDWLNLSHNRARVHAVRQAHARHGGTGAFYVLLRRSQPR